MSEAMSRELSPSVRMPRRAGFLWRLLRRPLAMISVAWLVLSIVASLGASLWAPYDPLELDFLAVKQLPSAAHWLGTDMLGRDVLSRLLHGGTPTVAGILQALIVAGVVGIGLGVCAGYFRGWFDRLVSQYVNLIMSLPMIIVLLSVLTTFSRDMLVAMVTFGFVGSASIARVVRSATLNIREDLYIEAARVAGLGDLTIIVRHVVPRIRGTIVVQLALFAAVTVLTQTGISFLGLGVQPPHPTWGGMIAEAAISLNDFPWLLVPSGFVVAMTILAFGLLGDAVRDAVTEVWSGAPIEKKVAAVARKAESSAVAPVAGAVFCAHNITISTGEGPGRRVLVNDVSFHLQRGETLGIVGESGSGKTLTSLSLLGLQPASTRVESGAVTVNGETISFRDEARLRRLRGRTIGMIFQEPMVALDPCFSVGHHLVEVIRQAGRLSPIAARDRALDLLSLVKIADPRAVARRFPHQISGGMAQRVGIARALALEPQILLADEPTTALDVTVQAEIIELIRGLSKSRDMSVVMVTHDWGVVADICDRAMVLYNGNMVESAPVREIFHQPKHAYTAALLRSNPYYAKVGEPLPTVQDFGGRGRP